MPKKSTPSASAPAVEETLASSGPAALKDLKPRLDALSEQEVQTPRLSLELALLAALGVSRRVHEERLLAQFQLIPEALLDPAHLDQLEPLIWATWHASRQYRSHNAASTEATLPASLVQKATEVEARMQRCVEYHLSSHPVAGTKVAFLRPGTGYRDLANDLLGYAELYRDYLDEISHDRRNYKASDQADAQALATRMIKLLADGSSDEARSWLRTQNRCWTLLERSYNEVASTGRWLLRNDPDVDTLFPSLYAIARSGGPRSQSTEEEEGEADTGKKADPA